MNDEGSVFENTETSPCPSCDTVEAEIASAKDAVDCTSDEQASTGTDKATTGISSDTGTDLDSDCEDSDSETQESELEQLRSELKQLREELALRDARSHQDERISQEYTEFCNLYPEVPIASLSQEVWQTVENGTPLAAAFALAERKKAIALKKAGESNATNRARSAGAVNNAQSVEFSPAEVRAMSSAEVRANLPKIMRSMQKWH